MKGIFIGTLAVFLLVWGTADAFALTAEEVIRLKQAGVSDATIQKMLEQEKAGGGAGQGPVSETKDEIRYQAGQNVQADMQRNREHERWKEEKSMEALKGIIIDQRKQ
jgi:hypothetical protein